MKIQKVRFLNFKNVPDIEKELNGSNIILLAENTHGKSNFIKGIQAALAGTIGKHAIKEGADKSEVEVVASDFNENGELIPGTDYTFKMKIKRDKDGDEKVTLEVTAPNGMRDTKKTVIGSIAGETELDYNFVELSKTPAGKKKQLEIIKTYLPEETKEQLRIWESKVKKAYEDRTEINRIIKTLEGFIQESGLNPEDFKNFTSAIDVTPLQQQISDAAATNSKIEGIKNRMTQRNERIVKIDEEISKLQLELQSIGQMNNEARKHLEDNTLIDISAVTDQINMATKHNAMVEKVATMRKKQSELEANKAESGDLTALHDSTKQAIQDAIRDMDFPIEGITFDSENVYYKGKMIDESTLSTAEIMMLEVELKMSKMPGAEVVFIQRGESLGKTMLIELQKRAKERGYQLIMEQVERGTEELKIELMPNYIN